VVPHADAQQQQHEKHDTNDASISFDPIPECLSTVPNLAYYLQRSPGLRIAPSSSNTNGHQLVTQQPPDQHHPSSHSAAYYMKQACCSHWHGATLAWTTVILSPRQKHSLAAQLDHCTKKNLHLPSPRPQQQLQNLDLRFIHNCADERSSNSSYLDFRIQINAFKNNSHSVNMSP
jgi:hypothetical protein